MLTCLLSAMFFAKPEVAAWIVGHNPVSVERFRERAKQLDAVFMEYYMVTKEGAPARRDQYRAAFEKTKEIATKQKVQLYAMISNYASGDGEDGFDAARMMRAVASEDSRRQFAEKLVKMLKADGAQGVDLDLESMKADDRDRYSALVAAIAKEVHRENLKLSVTVHPKEEPVGSWDGPKAQDYRALGLSADRFNVMTYDFSWSNGPEGPIAPNDWVERVIRFAVTQAPPTKIALGISCYGYDWSKKPATSLTFPDFVASGAKLDSASGEVVQGKQHFSGAEAFRQKYVLASKLGVRSVAFWYCGSEDPAIWAFLPTRP